MVDVLICSQYVLIMKHQLTQEAIDAILGTLVADAAGMGVHWIYSQGKIASIVKANKT